MSHNNSYPILRRSPYHNRSYHIFSLGVIFRAWCLMRAVATLRKQLNNETLNNKSSHSETHLS